MQLQFSKHSHNAFNSWPCVYLWNQTYLFDPAPSQTTSFALSLFLWLVSPPVSWYNITWIDRNNDNDGWTVKQEQMSLCNLVFLKLWICLKYSNVFLWKSPYCAAALSLTGSATSLRKTVRITVIFSNLKWRAQFHWPVSWMTDRLTNHDQSK